MISLLHANVVLFVERRYDDLILQSIVAHFFTNICFKFISMIWYAPKFQSLKQSNLVIVNFLSIQNYLLLPRFFHDPAVYVWIELLFWSLEKSSLSYRSSLSTVSRSSLYPSSSVLRICLANIKKGRKKVGYLSR